MAKLIYGALASLDGSIADDDGRFDWAEPDPEVHAFVNDLERPVGTYLYGRRMYEVMVAWETFDLDGQPPHIRDYAEQWRDTDKIVYSRLEREFDPEAVRRLKAAADRDLAVGGAGLAAHALAAGLVDEVHLFLTPYVVGGGTRVFPDGVHAPLELLEERRFGNGVVYVRYRLVL